MDHIGRRPYKGDTGLHAGAGKIGILREKSVPGVDRVGAALAGRPDYSFNAQIILPRAIAYHDRVIRESDKERFLIRVLVNSHGLEPQLLDRPNQPQGYFTPVGNQNPLYILTICHLYYPSRKRCEKSCTLSSSSWYVKKIDREARASPR